MTRRVQSNEDKIDRTIQLCNKYKCTPYELLARSKELRLLIKTRKTICYFIYIQELKKEKKHDNKTN